MYSDLISRQVAIDALNSIVRTDNWKAAATVTLLELPSVQPERKKGFWFTLKKGDKGYSARDFKCSVCGEPNHTWLPRPKFCSNCGAEMSIYEEPVKISLGIN